MLSILKDPFYFNDVNIKDFICGSNDEITLILDMINIIFQKNNISSNEKWKLIPKYVTIFNKIGCIGIYKFINHLNLSSNINFYDEVVTFGNGISTDAGGNASGFYVNQWVSTALVAFGSVEIILVNEAIS